MIGWLFVLCFFIFWTIVQNSCATLCVDLLMKFEPSFPPFFFPCLLSAFFAFLHLPFLLSISSVLIFNWFFSSSFSCGLFFLCPCMFLSVSVCPCLFVSLCLSVSFILFLSRLSFFSRSLFVSFSLSFSLSLSLSLSLSSFF